MYRSSIVPLAGPFSFSFAVAFACDRDSRDALAEQSASPPKSAPLATKPCVHLINNASLTNPFANAGGIRRQGELASVGVER
eukprot:722155-Prymnesium_polylepis.1